MQAVSPLTKDCVLKTLFISNKSITTERSQNKKAKCNFFENEVATS